MVAVWDNRRPLGANANGVSFRRGDAWRANYSPGHEGNRTVLYVCFNHLSYCLLKVILILVFNGQELQSAGTIGRTVGLDLAAM